MKKIVALVLALIMAFSLVACKSATEPDPGNTQKPQSNNVAADAPIDAEQNAKLAWEDTMVKVSIDVDPGTFGPFETNNNGRRQVLPSIFETLAEFQGHGGPLVGVLAKDWKPVDGEENTYIIELHDNITDGNGNKLTASDIIFSFTEGKTAFKRYVGVIKEMEALDELKLKVALEDGTADALELLLTMVWICDQQSYEADPDKMAYTPVGTGPYKYVSSIEGSKVVLEAREDYWREEGKHGGAASVQNVKTIEFEVVKESSQKAILLETGDIDVVSGMTYDQASRFMENNSYSVLTNTDNKARTLIFNCNDLSVCSSLELRQAILHAFDNAQMLAGFDNAGEVAFTLGNTTYSDISMSWDDGNYYPYDTAKAKELLKAAGYEDGVTVRLMTDTSEMNGKIANILASYLSQVGITLEINQYEETLVKTYKSDFSMFDIYLVYNGNPNYLISMWNERLTNESNEKGLNYCGINDEKLQELLVIARTAATHNEENMTNLHNYIKDNAYIYAMFTPYVYTVGNSNLQNVYLTAEMWMVPGRNVYVWNQ